MNGNKFILLVEDNEPDVLLTQRALKKNKIPIKMAVARDGEEALNYLFCEGEFSTRNPEEIPHLILLDLNLPKIDGLEVLRRIRANEKLKRLPVVVMTSSKQYSDLEKCYELGANSYIRKPVDFLEFSEAIKGLINYWLLLNIRVPVGRSS